MVKMLLQTPVTDGPPSRAGTGHDDRVKSEEATSSPHPGVQSLYRRRTVIRVPRADHDERAVIPI
jgi:hypothetical protein